MEIDFFAKKSMSKDSSLLQKEYEAENYCSLNKRGLTLICKNIQKSDKNLMDNIKKRKTSLDENESINSIKDFAAATEQNKKYNKYMEDFYLAIDNFDNSSENFLFCIFDGHGGCKTAQKCTERYPEILKASIKSNPYNHELALKFSFYLLDKEIENMNVPDIGNTATVALISKKMFYCANVGDSSCVLVNDKEAKFVSTNDNFNNQSEIKRLKKLEAKIENDRLDGILAITRSIGDFSLKKKGLICEPHIYSKFIDQKLKYCVLGSDGIWDVLKEQDIFNICHRYSSPTEISQNIVEEAKKLGSLDNISCIVFEFKKKA